MAQVPIVGWVACSRPMRGRRLRRFASVMAAGMAFAAPVPSRAGQVALTPVAVKGQQVPGSPAGVTYSTFGPSVMANGGTIAFAATLAGSAAGVTSSNNTAFIGGPYAAPLMIARTGQPAPGTAAGTTYASIHPGYLASVSPSVNGLGQVAYNITLSTTGTANALYFGPPAAPQLVYRQGSQAAGLAAGVTYNSFGASLGRSTGGSSHADLAGSGSGVTIDNDTAVYTGLPTSPTLVFREGDQAPDLSVGVKLAAMSLFGNEAGQLSSQVQLTGTGVTTANQYALYAGPATAPRLIARTGSQAAGMPTGLGYSAFYSVPTLSEDGRLAFLALLKDTATSAFSQVLYAGPTSDLRPVARTGDPVPGLLAGVT